MSWYMAIMEERPSDREGARAFKRLWSSVRPEQDIRDALEGGLKEFQAYAQLRGVLIVGQPEVRLRWNEQDPTLQTLPDGKI